MNKSAIVGLAAAVALCGCHGTAANQQGTNATSIANDTGGTPVTLIGCLVPGGGGVQSGAVGTAGNAGPAGFTLIDVTTTGSGAASGVSGTSGTPGQTPAVDTGTPRSYDLVGDKKQGDLQKYQNSRVEVTGVMVASTDTGAGVPDVGAAPAPAGTPATSVQRVRVDNVRQLEATCGATSPK
jgi:hypothetical protein